MKTAIILLLFFLTIQEGLAQYSIHGGYNFNHIRTKHLKGEVSDVRNYHFGHSLNLHFFKKAPNVGITLEINVAGRIYRQQLDELYTTRLYYLSFPLMVNYTPFKQVAFQTGFEIDKLLATNVENGIETFNGTDIGLVLGCELFPKSRISLYTRGTIGMLPMLDYYAIDELGNMSSIKDMRNLSIYLGASLKLFKKKIQFYE